MNHFNFEGEFYEGKMRGPGTASFGGGIQCKNTWFNGLPTSFCSLNISQSNKVKIGYFKDKYKMGMTIFDKNWNIIFGKIKFKNGDVYKGFMKNQIIQGKGHYVWVNGSQYKGFFKGGQAHGQGRLELLQKIGGIPKVYEGCFQENRLSKENLKSYTFMDVKQMMPDAFIEVPALQKDNFKIVYTDVSTNIDDIRSVISIEYAFKLKYIENIDDFEEYKNYCDGLEIENILYKNPWLIVEATQSMSLDDLLKDMLRTQSTKQLYIVDLILKLNFEFLIIFDPIRATLVNPCDRIKYRGANRRVYEATKMSLVEEITVVLTRRKNKQEVPDFGPLIFDEMFLMILKTGLIGVPEIHRIMKAILPVYGRFLVEEVSLLNKDREKYKKKFENYASRRITLAQILLSIVTQLFDAQILLRSEVIFESLFLVQTRMSYAEYCLEVGRSYNKLFAMVLSLFENYLCNEYYGKEFKPYFKNYQFFSDLCLNILYVLLSVNQYGSEQEARLLKQIGKSPAKKKGQGSGKGGKIKESSLHWSAYSDHVLAEEFKMARIQCETSAFTFGFFLKDILEDFDFGSVFKIEEEQSTPADQITPSNRDRSQNITFFGNNSTLEQHISKLSQMLIPSFIVCYGLENPIKADHHPQLIQTFSHKFSIFQINSDKTMEKFIKWIRSHPLQTPHNHFSDWINQRGLGYIDHLYLFKKLRNDTNPKNHKNNIKLLFTILRTFDQINNAKKVPKLSPSGISIAKIHYIIEASEYQFEAETRDFSSWIQKALHQDSSRLSKQQYNFLMALLELRFQHVVYPKFLMRNSCICSINTKKLKAFEFNTRGILGNLFANSTIKKEIYHALIIGYTFNFREVNLARISSVKKLVSYANIEDISDAYTRDLVYFVSLICSRIWFEKASGEDSGRGGDKAGGSGVSGADYSDLIDEFRLVEKFLHFSYKKLKSENKVSAEYEELEAAGNLAGIVMNSSNLLNKQTSILLGDGSVKQVRRPFTEQNAIDEEEDFDEPSQLNQVPRRREQEIEEDEVEDVEEEEGGGGQDQVKGGIQVRQKTIKEKKLEAEDKKIEELIKMEKKKSVPIADLDVDLTANYNKIKKVATKKILQWEKLKKLWEPFGDVINAARALIEFDINQSLSNMNNSTLILNHQASETIAGSGASLGVITNPGAFNGMRKGSGAAKKQKSMVLSNSFNSEKVALTNNPREQSLRGARSGVTSNSSGGDPSRPTEVMGRTFDSNFRRTQTFKNELNLKELISSLVKQNLVSEPLLRILTRHLTRCTANLFSTENGENNTALLEVDSTVLNMISVIKDMLQIDENLQSIIVNELNRISDEESAVVAMIKNSLFLFLTKSRQNKITSNLHQSVYLDSYSFSWHLRRNFNFFIKNISENKNLTGKLLFHRLEPKTKMIELYLVDLQKSLSLNNTDKKADLALQIWKLDQLQELCVGPCSKNQAFVTQKKFMSIFNLGYLINFMPLDYNHLKYKRDYKLIVFWLGALEGSKKSIVKRIKKRIKADELLSYLKKILLILHLNWNCKDPKVLNNRFLLHEESEGDGEAGVKASKGDGEVEGVLRRKGSKRLNQVAPKQNWFQVQSQHDLQRSVLSDNWLFFQNLTSFTLSSKDLKQFKKSCIRSTYGKCLLYDLAVHTYQLMISKNKKIIFERILRALLLEPEMITIFDLRK